VEGNRWQIGVEKPTAQGRVVHRVLALTDIAMATSGDYRNYYVKDGLRISHTIDPRTSRPVTHELASVTVLCEDCETADALATALMVLGPDEGYNLAESSGIAALFLIRQGADSYLEKVTSAFASATSSSVLQDTTSGKRGERR
jgi:thiamine biosynthesis lipoprotein